MTRADAIKELEQLSGDELCTYCKYEMDGCTGNVSGGPNGPIYPPCAGGNAEDYINIEDYIESREEELCKEE